MDKTDGHTHAHMRSSIHNQNTERLALHGHTLYHSLRHFFCADDYTCTQPSLNRELAIFHFSLQLADCIQFHFLKLIQTIGLYAGYFVTVSQLSLASCLYNAKSPYDTRKQLKLPSLSKEICEAYDQALIPHSTRLMDSPSKGR